MFVASKCGKQKVYHVDTCGHVKHMTEGNRILFYTEQEAKEAGFRACNCCSKMARQYRKEKKAIADICSKNNISVKLYNGELHIDTCIESWKIIITERKRCLVLLHANKGIYRLKKTENGMVVHDYHLQKNIHATTIVKYLKYILKHDDWLVSGGRENHYKSIQRNSRKNRNKYNAGKKKAKRQAVLRVCNMIERLESGIYKEGDLCGA